MKAYSKTILVMLVLIVSLSSFSILVYSSQPPEGYTGSDGFYCTNCHSTNPLNSNGGMVVATGLPIAGYTAGTTYNFSIATTHSVADRKRWGFEIAARNSQNQNVGSFSTTNPNAAVNGAELAHNNAVSTDNAASFTYNNLSWTAPSNPGVADQTITFYYAANAANGAGSSGDFIYAGTARSSLLITYTFTGNGNWTEAANWSNNTIPPADISGSNTQIIIDPPANGECVLNIVQRISGNAKLTVKDGKKFRVSGNLIINN
jgi:hypothetical protein